MEIVNVTCRLPVDDVAFVDSMARVTERDRSYFIKKAVSEYVALHRLQLEEVEKAIEEADAGHFATDADVKAVCAKLGA